MRRNTAATRDAERDSIMAFVLARVRPADEASPTPIADLFAAYQDWRIEQGAKKTRLDCGGFGRMFPKLFKRRVVWVGKYCRRCVMGVRVA